MYRMLTSFVLVGFLAVPGWGAPREWSDDFLTVTTYDSGAWLAPCYGGPSTKYTALELTTGDPANEQVVSRDGRLMLTNRDVTGLLGRLESIAIGAVSFNQPCPDVAGLPFGESTESFTSDKICVYGGMAFSPYEMSSSILGNTYNIKGPDGAPGIVNVDDDLDGTTDEDDESPAAHPTTVGGGYGNPDGTGFWAGADGAPGVVNVDDDGNGTTDDVGETRAAGSDDSDDGTRQTTWFILNTDINASSAMYLEMDLLPPSDLFNLWEIVSGQSNSVEHNDELAPGFYEPGVHYGYVFCVSGTCYGAQMWTQADMANANETLGPVTNSNHDGPAANLVGFGSYQKSEPDQFIRRKQFLTNLNFSRKYWVISGDPTIHYPSVSADLDNDRDVDGQDFLTFSVCYNGSLKAPQAACSNTDADLDADGDVDGQDFLTFSVCYNGSLKKPQAACFPPVLTITDCAVPE